MNFDFLIRSRNLHAATNAITLNIDGLQFKVLDDGGRRLEPHEWIRRYQGLDAMIYIVSLPSYCQTTPGPSSKVGSPHHLNDNDYTDVRDQRTRCRSP